MNCNEKPCTQCGESFKPTGGGSSYCSIGCTLLSGVDNHGGGCWSWNKATCYGYGKLAYGRRQYRAHRVSWEVHKGQIPDGMSVLHRCDNPSCCNPAHLFLGTHDDNMADKVTKNRQAKGSGHGRAKLSESDVISIRNSPLMGVALAEKYGVSNSTISFIVNDQTWKHVG